jgi:hypothetical protein
MNKLVFAFALLSSLAVPASAAVRKDVADARPHAERWAIAHPSKEKVVSLRKTDPYWQPCDYFSGYGDNSCGD